MCSFAIVGGWTPPHPQRRESAQKNEKYLHPLRVWVVSGFGICGAFEVMQNYLIVFETGENCVIHAGDGLTLAECRKFAQKVGGAVADAYELGAYILGGGYNPQICDYINSVNWL